MEKPNWPLIQKQIFLGTLSMPITVDHSPKGKSEGFWPTLPTEWEIRGFLCGSASFTNPPPPAADLEKPFSGHLTNQWGLGLSGGQSGGPFPSEGLKWATQILPGSVMRSSCVGRTRNLQSFWMPLSCSMYNEGQEAECISDSGQTSHSLFLYLVLSPPPSVSAFFPPSLLFYLFLSLSLLPTSFSLSPTFLSNWIFEY